MYVREYMKSPVITITSATLIHEAQKIMQEHKIHHLPVVDKGKLVGMVTQGRIRDAVPPSTGSLSMWEFNYLLSKMKVNDVMIKDIITVSPDATIEEACLLGEEKATITSFPVVNDKGKLVGIITFTDLYHHFTQILGFGEKGTRLFILNCEYGHIQDKVLEILYQNKAEVLSIFPITLVGAMHKGFVIRLATEDAESIATAIRKQGCEVEIRKHL